MTAAASQPRAPKVQRWIDLLAALLSRHYPATFREIAQWVPAYASGMRGDAALMRMFERDKDELRALGVPIDTVQAGDGETSAYRLARKDFYLPYLCAVSPSGKQVSRSAHVDRYGYQALATLAFESDELSAIAQAAARAESLGDPLLAEETRSAVRKLALDLPLEIEASAADTVLVTHTRASRAAFEIVDSALRRHKLLTFTYHAMTTDRTEERQVEPYGLFFVSGNWYLAGRDMERGAIRNFRLDRMTDITANAAASQTPDYSIPATFRLRDHARSRHAWELGDDDAVVAIIHVRGATGAALAAARLGEPVPDDDARRLFRVRRSDTFVRWLLSFGGDLVPLSPDSLVAEFTRDARATLDLYARAGARP